jgi:hypothetical protein
MRCGSWRCRSSRPNRLIAGLAFAMPLGTSRAVRPLWGRTPSSFGGPGSRVAVRTALAPRHCRCEQAHRGLTRAVQPANPNWTGRALTALDTACPTPHLTWRAYTARATPIRSESDSEPSHGRSDLSVAVAWAKPDRRQELQRCTAPHVPRAARFDTRRECQPGDQPVWPLRHTTRVSAPTFESDHEGPHGRSHVWPRRPPR